VNKSKFISTDIDSENCQTSFIDFIDWNRELILTIQCINTYNELEIKLYNCYPENQIIFYNYNNYILKLDNKNMITNFSCEKSFITKEILSCFIEFINKIYVYSFTFDSNYNIKLYSKNIISNSGGIILKTISNFKYDFLICFTDYFYDNSICTI
jgi:hypothetical protein